MTKFFAIDIMGSLLRKGFWKLLLLSTLYYFPELVGLCIKSPNLETDQGMFWFGVLGVLSVIWIIFILPIIYYLQFSLLSRIYENKSTNLSEIWAGCKAKIKTIGKHPLKLSHSKV